MIVVSTSTLAEWRETRWKVLDTDALEAGLKELAKELKRLHKAVRAWPAHVRLHALLTETTSSLNCLIELRNPAIKRRHWRQLINATQVHLALDDLNFKLGDLLDLGLSRFAEEVSSIVDVAIKESSVERVLESLEATWSTLAFEFPPHERTGVPTLRLPENFIDLLEDNQVILQNLLSSRFVMHFQHQVQSWMVQLTAVDNVCHSWADVMGIWSYLESIFSGTSDIRQQLPDDALRFDVLDQDWRALMVFHFITSLSYCAVLYGFSLCCFVSLTSALAIYVA